MVIAALLEWLAYPIVGAAGGLGMYAPGDGPGALAASTLAHGSALHVWKTVVALLLGVALARRLLGWPALVAWTVGCAMAGNWAHAVVFSTPTYGASMGTFALMGVGSVVAWRRWPGATAVGVSLLATHQILFGDPSIVTGHVTAGVAGVVVGYSSRQSSSNCKLPYHVAPPS